jgi:2-methylcitrate dehydratase PrpD
VSERTGSATTDSPSARLAQLTDPAVFTVRPEAIEFAVWMVADSLSVAIAGARLESDVVRAVGRTMSRQSGVGRCAAFPIGKRLAPGAAAAVNACAVHSIDFDDSYMAGGVKAHFSASIIPTALAVAEDIDATGAAFLDAVVRGFEVAARLGHALTPAVVDRWHPTGVIGVVGCAAAAGSLLGLRGDAAEMALGLAADHAAGTRFCLASGDATKSLHAAFAAHDGMLSAHMAADGVAGPLGFLDGLKGFCETYIGSVPALTFPGDADGRALIELNCTKFFPVMHALHAAADVAVAVAARHPVTSPMEIREIEVTQSTTHATFGAYYEPETELAARLSLPYTMAATLLDGACGLDQFTAARLADPQFRSLLGRVRITGSAELERNYGGRVASSVRVVYADGSVEEGFGADPLGFPERPATPQQRLQKARSLLTRVMSVGDADALIATIRALASASSLGPLTDLLLQKGVLP